MSFSVFHKLTLCSSYNKWSSGTSLLHWLYSHLCVHGNRIRCKTNKRICYTLTPGVKTESRGVRQCRLIPRPWHRYDTQPCTVQNASILHSGLWSCNRRFIKDLDLADITETRTDRYTNSSFIVFANVMKYMDKRVNKLLIHFFY